MFQRCNACCLSLNTLGSLVLLQEQWIFCENCLWPFPSPLSTTCKRTSVLEQGASLCLRPTYVGRWIECIRDNLWWTTMAGNRPEGGANLKSLRPADTSVNAPKIHMNFEIHCLGSESHIFSPLQSTINDKRGLWKKLASLAAKLYRLELEVKKLFFEEKFWPASLAQPEAICYLLSETMWSWRYKLVGWWHVECPRVLPVRRTLQIRYPVRMRRQHHSQAQNTSALIGTASAHPPQLGSQHVHACCNQFPPWSKPHSWNI